MTETPPPNPLAPPSPEQIERIRVRAYHLWQADGCPEGREAEYWQRAEELQAIAEYPAGTIPVGTPRGDEVVDEAELQDNLGEFPGRQADQGEDRPTPMTRTAEHAELERDRQ
jgi:hypothetical protein